MMREKVIVNGAKEHKAILEPKGAAPELTESVVSG